MGHTNPTIIEKTCMHLEHWHAALSDMSIYPIVGMIPAAAKVLLGIIETVVAAVFFIIALIPSLCSKTARSMLAFSAIHIGRGLLRTVVGAVLAVPLLGTVFICGLDGIADDCCGIVSLATDGNVESGSRLSHSVIFA